MSELDDLKSPSITEEQPLFSIKNIFKPTSKNMIIWGTLIETIAAGSVLNFAFMIAKDPHYYAIIIGCSVLFGALGKALIMFTKQEPISTLIRAAEDIKITPAQNLIQETNDTSISETPPTT